MTEPRPLPDDLTAARRTLADAMARCEGSRSATALEAVRAYADCVRAAGVLPEPLLTALEQELAVHTPPDATAMDARFRWERALDWALQAERRRRWQQPPGEKA